MWDDIAGAYGSRFFLAAGGVALALILLVGVLWILRNRAPSPFVRGGKSRQPRLQVLDAAAVDARRRLVLVRRDGIEHLIMIGGPTDIVIETGISDPTKAGAAASLDISAATPENRPQLQQRVAEPNSPPVALPVQRQQPAEDSLEAYLRSGSVAAATPKPAPQPVERAPQPLAAPPQRAPQPAPVITEAEAADILDAARHAVLPPQAQPQPVRAAPVEPTVTPPVAQPASNDAANDFQKILEAEMSKNLTAERIIPSAPPQRQVQQQPAAAASHSPAQRVEPELAPMTGADSALQKEVARIFGEMSVSRDK
ncbi:flagellar biosynthetic protein FliO [Rhizobium sp. BR 314]|uniref:flagellar biosynthetic protein FliO n=1 Tax=Rhizobium sp. BR 314 TaxID=3040013 RepID=UPI0039BF9089